jgi:lysozyme family protein
VADFAYCFAFILSNEDHTPPRYEDEPDAPGSYAVVNGVRVWNGARAISGINSHAWPAQYAVVAAVQQDARGPAVQTFYQTYFWSKWLAALTAPQVAAVVVDAMVNEGPGVGARLLQEAVNDSNATGGHMLNEDGALGAATVAAANTCDPVKLLAAFMDARTARYKALVDSNPADTPYLAGWLARASKLPPPVPSA